MENLEDKINNYPTKNKIGFIDEEIDELMSGYPGINKVKFNRALVGITTTTIDGDIVIYHRDIINALRCGLENRDLTEEEFD